MIVCDNPKFVFVHIPRTGGTSITNWLMQTFGMKLHQIHQQHSGLGSLSSQELEQYSSYWKFTVVRHPVDRLISWHHHSRSNKGIIDYYKSLSDEQFFLNQVDYFILDDGSLWADEILRFENLHQDMERLSQKLGLHSSGMPHINASKSGSLIGAEEEAFLRGVCERDLEYLGYK